MRTKGELCALAAVALVVSGTSASDAMALDAAETSAAAQCAPPIQFADLWVKVVAKAWSDETFKRELLANPAKALKNHFNYTVPPGMKLEFVESKPDKPDVYKLTLPAKPNYVSPEDLSRMQALERFMFPC